MAPKTHRPVGRPSLGYGERHSVVTKWDESEMEKLRQLAAQHNTSPGPFLTNLFRAQLATMDVRDFQLQEALPIDKAS
jgi:hypothetical protein